MVIIDGGNDGGDELQEQEEILVNCDAPLSLLLTSRSTTSTRPSSSPAPAIIRRRARSHQVDNPLHCVRVLQEGKQKQEPSPYVFAGNEEDMWRVCVGAIERAESERVCAEVILAAPTLQGWIEAWVMPVCGCDSIVTV